MHLAGEDAADAEDQCAYCNPADGFVCQERHMIFPLSSPGLGYSLLIQTERAPSTSSLSLTGIWTVRARRLSSTG